MKLLIVTQKVDLTDDLLGVYHEWIKELATKVESLSVVCLYRGKVDLPANVSVYSLGKETGRSRMKYLWRFCSYLWRLRHDYETVFVHMNPEYLLLAGWWWRLTGKHTALWYAHYLKTWRLVCASWFTDRILTSVPQAFPFFSAKVVAVGQGIDTRRFSPDRQLRPRQPVRLLFVGRISPIKDLLTLVDAVCGLRQQQVSCLLTIVGAPGEGDHDYWQKVRLRVNQLKIDDHVVWLGRKSNKDMPEIYRSNDVCINLTRTGSFDKTTLEAMASGLLVLTANQAFLDIFPKSWQEDHIFAEGDSSDLADKVVALLKQSAVFWVERGQELREIIVHQHSLDRLTERLKDVLHFA